MKNAIFAGILTLCACPDGGTPTDGAAVDDAGQNGDGGITESVLLCPPEVDTCGTENRALCPPQPPALGTDCTGGLIACAYCSPADLSVSVDAYTCDLDKWVHDYEACFQ
jgi:hypothetical protein